jgi:hypothetical protein
MSPGKPGTVGAAHFEHLDDEKSQLYPLKKLKKRPPSLIYYTTPRLGTSILLSSYIDNMDDDYIVSAKYCSRGKLGCDIAFDYHYNVATNISITKKRTLVEALIAINKFKLPNELIDIIKDYVFRDKIAMLQRSIFQKGVLHSIRNIEHYYPPTSANCCGQNRAIMYEIMYHDFPDYIQFERFVCKTCGEINKYNGCQRCYPEEYQLQINYENEDDYDHYDEFPM